MRILNMRRERKENQKGRALRAIYIHKERITVNSK
jgi:hypothetical protein